MLKAEELLGHSNRSSFASIKWVVDGEEPILLRDQFSDWEDLSWDLELREKERKQLVETSSRMAPEVFAPLEKASKEYGLDKLSLKGYLDEKVKEKWKSK